VTDHALLVIDLQRGAFDGARCPQIDGAQTLLGNARALIDAARASGTPVVFVQHCEAEAGSPFETDSPHGDLEPALGALSGDLVVRKQASSAFDNTTIVQTLAELGARKLLLCGLQSEFCVSNTARSALAAGYDVLIAEDAHGTWASDGQAAAAIAARVNAELLAAGAKLQPTSCIVQSLATSAT